MTHDLNIQSPKQDNRDTSEQGFTFIELIMVITMIGILVSVALQKMITTAEKTELIAEDMTIDTMRSNIVANFGSDLLEGKAAKFPDDPFSNLAKVPRGYNNLRNTQPTGEDDDSDIWVFSPSTGSSALTVQQSGTTITSFTVTGNIFHQRKDNTIVKWPYDGNSGVIGRKVVAVESPLRQELDQEKRARGETPQGEVPVEKK